MPLSTLRTFTPIALLISLVMMIAASGRAGAQAYHLTFDDEFNSLSLSNQDINGDGGPQQRGIYETWYRSHPSRHLLTGEQEEFIDPFFYGLPQQGPASLGINPFSVHNGILTIGGNPAPPADYAYLDNQKYTSGLLTTFSSFSQTYGYFECRARLPQGAGLWPAFWMLPVTQLPGGDLKWQYEIDVFECFGNATPAGGGSNQVHWALHNGSKGWGDWATVPGNIYTGYHTYGVDWEPYPGNCTFYFDGKVIGKAVTTPDMNQPMFLIVALALGGTWMGPPDPASGEFPAKMDVDYVRAYSNNPNVPAVKPQHGYAPSSTIPIPLAGAALHAAD